MTPSLTLPKQPPMTSTVEWDFIRSTELTDLVATTTGAGSAMSHVASHGGSVRLTTDANDNDRVEVQSDIGFVVLKNGTSLFEFLWTAPSEVDNADFAIGFATLDTDVIGDSATATELLLLAVDDANGAAGDRTLTLKLKNATSSESVDTGLVVEAGVVYHTVIRVVQTAAGAGTVEVQHYPVTGGGFYVETGDGTDGAYTYKATYLPTSVNAMFFGLQNGSAAARTMDVDKVKIVLARYNQ